MSLHEFEKIAIVGATGAVGTEALRLLEERGVPAERIVALASVRSEGAEVEYAGGTLRVRETTEAALEGVDLALFCASGAVSRRFIPGAVARGTVVVDNSSAFRMQDGVPLVVPEVNGELIGRATDRAGSEARSVRSGRGAREGGTDRRSDGRWHGLIANPNCSTILLLVALEPLRRAFGVGRVVVSTYQAVSGAGAKGMEELVEQTRGELRGEAKAAGAVFAEPCAFNVFSHNSAVDVETGLNVEEQKLIDETRKIWNDPTVAISPTCVRVPVLRAHSESVTVTLKRATTEGEVREALRGGAGVEVIDDRAGNCFPTPRKASGRDEVLVGRVRRDPGAAVEGRGFQLWLCGDQLRKGAALNAVQIAEIVGARRAQQPASKAAVNAS